MSQKTVLISPLNWGLGHATRCIPLIKKYQEQNYQVVIAANGAALTLLRQEFPSLIYEDIGGFEARYSKNIPFFLNLMMRSPSFFYSIQKEQKILGRLCEKYQPELVISDNRYGFRHPDFKSVLITHQLFPIVPKIIESQVFRFLRKKFESFDEVWVPDYEGDNNLSGKLSHSGILPGNVKYIGPLSRFTKRCEVVKDYEFEYMGIVSGPEPYRQELFNKLLNLFKLSGKKTVLIGGLPDKIINIEAENIEIHNHLPTDILHDYLCKSRNIICRSGYSSLMDFEKTGTKAFLIPTPGQTEQEYLAEYSELNKRHIYLKNEYDLLKLF